jgi:hypothetical protein
MTNVEQFYTKTKFNALTDLSIEDYVKPKFKHHTKEELIIKIQNKAKKLGRIPISNEMKNPSSSSYEFAFGSWNNALLFAGFDTNKIIYKDKISKEEAFQLYLNLSIKLHRFATNIDIQEAHKRKECCSVDAFKQNFGGLKNIRKAFSQEQLASITENFDIESYIKEFKRKSNKLSYNIKTQDKQQIYNQLKELQQIINTLIKNFYNIN